MLARASWLAVTSVVGTAEGEPCGGSWLARALLALLFERE
jgi:hypothetical protein